jgi:hypothetical protein
MRQAAMRHFDEIMFGPGQWVDTGKFIEKRLPDGRGLRFQHDWVFKGFIDCGYRKKISDLLVEV